MKKLAGALIELAEGDPAGDQLGAARRRPHRQHAAVRHRAASPTTGSCRRRAPTSVVKFLIENGVPANRLAAAGFGEFQPLDPANTPEARDKNRRIELKLTER